jgi:putative metallopeptidase DUF4344
MKSPFLLPACLASLRLWLSLLAASSAFAVEKTLPIEMSLQAGQSKSAKLQNVHAGSILSLAGEASCELWIDLKQATSDQRLFATKMPQSWNTVIRVDHAGEYRLYFHNRSQAACEFAAALTVRLDTPVDDKNSASLQKLSNEIQKVFIAEDIEYRLINCDTNNSFARNSTVLLCREHLERLQLDAASKQMAEDLFLFTLMHETSHVLLTQWQYPFNSNEDVVDEFAVVLTKLMKKDAAIDSQASYFEQQPAQSEYEHILKNNDRHTLSIQRARNLRNWAKDEALLARWMPLLIPHIQTNTLESLRQTPNEALRERISEELEQRASSVQNQHD